MIVEAPNAAQNLIQNKDECFDNADMWAKLGATKIIHRSSGQAEYLVGVSDKKSERCLRPSLGNSHLLNGDILHDLQVSSKTMLSCKSIFNDEAQDRIIYPPISVAQGAERVKLRNEDSSFRRFLKRLGLVAYLE